MEKTQDMKKIFNLCTPSWFKYKGYIGLYVIFSPFTHSYHFSFKINMFELSINI